MKDLPKEFYDKQNEMMALRYSKTFAKMKCRLNWDKFYQRTKDFFKDDEYKIWAFLAGLEETLKEAVEWGIYDKKLVKEYIEKQSKKRAFKIRGKDDDLQNLLRNL